MNERIKELAEQAGYLPDMFGVGHWDTPECKKFAELIVKDSIAGLLDAYGPDEHIPQEEIAGFLNNHFGVKE